MMLLRLARTRLPFANANVRFPSLRRNLISDTAWARLERWRQSSRSSRFAVARCCQRYGWRILSRARVWIGSEEKFFARRCRWQCPFRLDLVAATRRSYLGTDSWGVDADDTDFGSYNRHRFGESLWSARRTDPTVRIGTRSHHRVANLRTAASISGEAISSRQRGAGFENEATGSPVGVGHGGFLTGYSGCWDRFEPGGPFPGCGCVRHWPRLR